MYGRGMCGAAFSGNYAKGVNALVDGFAAKWGGDAITARALFLLGRPTGKTNDGEDGRGRRRGDRIRCACTSAEKHTTNHKRSCARHHWSFAGRPIVL